MTNASKKLQKLTADSRRASLEVAVEALLLKFCRDGGSSRLTADQVVEACEAVLVRGEDPPELNPWEFIGGGWRYSGDPAKTPNLREPPPSRPGPPSPRDKP